MAYWLIKSEPDVYPFTQLVKDKRARWDGIRSFEARNNLRAMVPGDLCLFYHSNVGKEVVGVAEVVKSAYPDPTAEGEDWSAVDVKPKAAFTRPVTLAEMKADPALAGLALIKKSRLSVVPVSVAHFAHIERLASRSESVSPKLKRAKGK